MDVTCSGCLTKIPDRYFLSCTSCKNKYDLECANVPIQRFCNTMTKEHKQTWVCQTCRCKKRKKDNTNTPIRPQESEIINQIPLDKNNITIRKPRNFVLDDNSISDDTSIFGDTIQNESCKFDLEAQKETLKAKNNNISIYDFEKLLERKLEESKQSIISELQALILSEVNKVISDLKIEIFENTRTLQSEQVKQKMDLKEINKAIHMLEIENKTMRTEIQELKNSITLSKDRQSSTNQFTEQVQKETSKRIVLHGLTFNYWETENELHDRVVNIFHDIMNIHLEPYIEDLTRIGRKSSNRPVVIELLSKRVTTFLLESKHCFKNTGLSISEFLTPESLKKRNQLRENLRRARKEGHHAIIKNNTLFIDGKESTELNAEARNVIPESQISYIQKSENAPIIESHMSQQSRRTTTSDFSVDAGASATTNTIQTKQKNFFRK